MKDKNKFISGSVILSLFMATFSSLASAGELIPASFVYNPAGGDPSFRSSVQGVCEAHASAWSNSGLPGTTCVSSDAINETYTVEYNTLEFTENAGRHYVCPPGSEQGQTFHDGTFCALSSEPLGPPEFCPAGNPINQANGNKFQVETDFQGSGSFPLVFKRTYNSKASSVRYHWDEPATPPSDYSDDDPYVLLDDIWVRRSHIGKGYGGALSYGDVPLYGQQTNAYTVSSNWTHTYQRSIRILDNGKFTTASIARNDGKVLYFKKNAENWIANNSADERLKQLTDGNGDLIGWELTDIEDNVETYDSQGKLVSIKNIAGLTHTLTYDPDGLLQQVEDSFGRKLSFTHDINKRIKTMTVPGNGQYLYTYDANDNLSVLTYPDLTTRTYLYEDQRFQNALTGILDQNGDRYATWAYDALGRAVLSKHAGGAEQVDVVYNQDGTSTVTEVTGNTRTHHFAELNGIIKQTQIDGPACQSCGGSNQTTTYDANGNRDIVTDFNGTITDYDYDLTRNLEISRIEAKGTPQERTILTEWHPDYRLKTCSIEPSRTVILDYYADSMLQSRTEVDTTNAILFRDAGFKTCDAIKARTDFSSLNKRAWTYSYDANNLLATVDGPRTDVNDITTYVRNVNNGNLESLTNAAGHTTQITAHDASGRPLRTVDANGLVTQLTYDALGRTDLIKVGTDTVYETTDLNYDGVGQLIKVTLADGSFLEYDYDAAHRLTDIRDQQRNHIHYELDAMGNRTSVDVKDRNLVLKRTHSYVFNTLNQLSQSIGADKGVDTQIINYDEYDANGNLKKTTDAQGNITQYGYDAFDRLDNVIDALNGTTSYTYDAMGNLETVTDPRNNTTVYQYDGLGNLIQLDSPDTGITHYTGYDGAGNLKAQTDAKDQTTVYAYDSLNRLTQITYSDDSTTVYAYDVGANAKGRLSSITDPSGSTAYAYDLHGRIASKTQIIGTSPDEISLPVAYHYNAQGQLDQITYPSGKVIGYSYSNGQISQLTVDGAVVLNNISYDPFGPVTGWDMGAGQSPNSISRLYDLDGQLSSYTLAGVTKQLSYANTGNITSLLEVGNAANDQSFDYDGLYRLTDYSGLGDTHVYGYDANGNRTAQVINGTGYGYSLETDNNRLQSVAGPTAKTYAYDALGNTISDGLHTYNYDARNRLTGLGTGIGYTLNGLGQRVAKTIPTVDPASLSGDANGDATVNALDYSLILDHILGIQAANNADCNEDGSVDVGDLVCVNIKSNGLSVNGKTHYVYDEQGQLIGEYDKDGNVILETVYLGNLPVAVLKAGNVYYIHADHLNTPRAITDAANNAYWSWLSDPFGVTAANDDVDGDGSVFTYNLRFPGQYFDEESGLHYNYFRDYDPATGRYVQSDPIGLSGGLNTYAYVKDNPLRYIDPLGLATCDGRWKMVRWTRDLASVFTGNCTCYWSCYSCPSSGTGDAFSDPNMGQNSTKGKIFFDPSRTGKDFDPEAGNACLCSAPSTEKGCDNCDDKK